MPKPKGAIEIGYRMHEEVCRLFKTQADATRRLRCHRHTIAAWSVGGCPDVHYLTRLHYAGGDVLYVLTGRRRSC